MSEFWIAVRGAFGDCVLEGLGRSEEEAAVTATRRLVGDYGPCRASVEFSLYPVTEGAFRELQGAMRDHPLGPCFVEDMRPLGGCEGGYWRGPWEFFRGASSSCCRHVGPWEPPVPRRARDRTPAGIMP